MICHSYYVILHQKRNAEILLEKNKQGDEKYDNEIVAMSLPRRGKVEVPLRVGGPRTRSIYAVNTGL